MILNKFIYNKEIYNVSDGEPSQTRLCFFVSYFYFKKIPRLLFIHADEPLPANYEPAFSVHEGKTMNQSIVQPELNIILNNAAAKGKMKMMIQAANSRPVETLLLTPKQASESLQISERQLWRLEKAGELRSTRIGKRVVRFSRDSLQEFIDRLTKRQNNGEGGAERTN
jgi:excisionase family DNA binding protein